MKVRNVLILLSCVGLLGACGNSISPAESEPNSLSRPVISNLYEWSRGNFSILEFEGDQFLLWEWMDASAMVRLAADSDVTLEEIKIRKVEASFSRGWLYLIDTGVEQFLLWEWGDAGDMVKVPERLDLTTLDVSVEELEHEARGNLWAIRINATSFLLWEWSDTGAIEVRLRP